MKLAQAQYLAREIDYAFHNMHDFRDKGYPESAEMWENIYYTLIRVRDRLIDLNIEGNS